MPQCNACVQQPNHVWCINDTEANACFEYNNIPANTNCTGLLQNMSQQGNCVSFVQSGNDPVCIGLCPCDTCIKQSPGYCVADETCAGYRTNCSFNSRNQNNCVYPQTFNPNVCTAKNCWGTPHTPPLYINYSVADFAVPADVWYGRCLHKFVANESHCRQHANQFYAAQARVQ